MTNKTYNKKSLSESVKYYLDNTGAKIAFSTFGNETTTPETVTKAYAEGITNHILTDIQNALINGGRVYFPEIGFIEVSKLKGGLRKLHNIATKEMEVIQKDKLKVKIRASKILSNKLNKTDEKQA